MIILNSESFIIINDNLDCDFLFIHLLKISNNLFNLNPNSTLDLMGDGLKLGFMHSPLNFTKFIFLIYNSLEAYFINSIIIRFIGFYGILKLIGDYFSIGKLDSFFIAICFSFLPIGNSLYGLSILGLPILLWAFINISLNNKLILSYSIFFLYPFYSYIQFSSPFIIVFYSLYILFNIILKKKIKYHFLNFLFFVSSVILSNFNLISTLTYEGDLKSARILRVVSELPSLLGIIYTFFKQLILGDNISSLFISLPLLVFLIFKWGKVTKKVKLLFLTVILNTLFYSLYPILNYYLPFIFGPFNFGRVIFLNSFLFFLILIKLNKLYSQTQFRILLFLLIILNLIRNQEFLYNVTKGIVEPNNLHWVYQDDKNLKSFFPSKIINNKPVDFHQKGFFYFNEYYSVPLFNKIKQTISKDINSFKSATIGVNPSIIQYNGFKSLTSYLVNYPISLHKKIERINKSKINPNGLYINTELKCGNYCNKFNSDIESLELDINIEALRMENIDYLFSAVEIENSKKLELKLLGVFNDKKSPYKIYLYEI